ncbi:hypothetical protein AA102526_2740 [Asaia lannensis NBRC 102526]|nr:hypothetical protein AA102526_2740 [Asaia lannensis NBRC 102526]
MGWILFPPESVWRHCQNGNMFRLPAILPNRAIWQTAQQQRNHNAIFCPRCARIALIRLKCV